MVAGNNNNNKPVLKWLLMVLSTESELSVEESYSQALFAVSLGTPELDEEEEDLEHEDETSEINVLSLVMISCTGT